MIEQICELTDQIINHSNTPNGQNSRRHVQKDGIIQIIPLMWKGNIAHENVSSAQLVYSQSFPAVLAEA